MKQKLEILLIGLKEYKLNEVRTNVIDAIDLLVEEINKADKAIKDRMKQSIDDGDLSKLQSMVQFCEVTKGLANEVSLLKTANIYNATPTSTDDVYIEDCTDYSGTRPWKIIVEGKEYILDKNNWRSFFVKVLTILAEKDPDRFMELVENVNMKNADWYRFSKNKSDLEDKEANKIVYLPSINLYVRFNSKANQMVGWAKEAFRFFKLQNNWSVETIQD